MKLSGVRGERGPAGGTEMQIIESILNDMRSSLAKPGELDSDGNRWVPVESFTLRQAMELLEHYNALLTKNQ